MVLVAGATGLVGSEICRLLRSTQRSVVALVRPGSRPERVAALRSMGCSIIVGDIGNTAILSRACRGVQTVVSTVSSLPFSWQPDSNTVRSVDHDGVRNLIDAAQAGAVERMVYITLSGNIDRDFPLRNAKRSNEAYLRASGLDYTILRPSFFMELWLSPLFGFDVANGRVTIYGDGQNKLSWISFGDVARFAVASLDHSYAKNATIELGGPQMRSQLEVVRMFENLAERSFVQDHVAVSPANLGQDDMQRSLAGLLQCYASGDPIPMETTQRIFRFDMVSLRDYALRVLATHELAVAG